jgi:ATP-dependent DNA helicase DinG
MAKDHAGGCLGRDKTFWQGVDVPGEALSLIVVDKVPVPNPKDPVIAKLSAKMESESFNRVSLPRAGRDVAQGAGRLIRTHSDKGVIAILDSRIDKKSWGKKILACLPAAASRTNSAEDVRRFFGDSGFEGVA